MSIFTALADDLQSTGTDTEPVLHHAQPVQRRARQPLRRRKPGRPGKRRRWLQQQIPAILDSPAFKQDGMLVITFDESEGKTSGPAGMVPGGTAGGRIGALVISPFTQGGTTSDTPYNHYSLLASIEDIFSLPRLGYAGAPGLNSFGPDVFNARPGRAAQYPLRLDGADDAAHGEPQSARQRDQPGQDRYGVGPEHDVAALAWPIDAQRKHAASASSAGSSLTAAAVVRTGAATEAKGHQRHRDDLFTGDLHGGAVSPGHPHVLERLHEGRKILSHSNHPRHPAQGAPEPSQPRADRGRNNGRRISWT